ncbi:MAG TPA: AI-2E family transporter [Nocardioidaceae bacterium]|nr:AI-2E family transporter [Nocardioidaceae bacterium]
MSARPSPPVAPTEPVAATDPAAPRARTPLTHRSPFAIGFFAALGALLAYWLGGLLLSIGSVLILVVVSMFLAVGLNPAVEWLGRRGLQRSLAVLVVVVVVLVAIALFLVALVPVIADQVALIATNAPQWFDEVRGNRQIQRLDARYDITGRLQNAVTGQGVGSAVFGGVVGVGVRLLSFLANTFIVVVLTLYFLSTLPKVKRALYRLAPATRRERVTDLGDRILQSVGAYVSGAFLVAMAAGISSLIFLFAVGLNQYAVALAAVVTVLDIIPMIGATLGAVVVTAIGVAVDPQIGLYCLIFYVLYQQLENYFIYPRVMGRSVDLPGSLIVIAALVGASLLGVVGALLAIPTAAALVLLTREVLLPRQAAR